MVNTGYRFGEFVEFQSHDRGSIVGLVLGQNFPDDFDSERTYFVLYRNALGEVHDALVAQCWIKPHEGHVSEEDFELTRFVRKLVKEATPEIELPNDE